MPTCRSPALPKFAKMEADSRYNMSHPYIIEDSIVVSCKYSTLDPGNSSMLYKFECRETGWSPDFNQTLPELCLPVSHIDVKPHTRFVF